MLGLYSIYCTLKTFKVLPFTDVKIDVLCWLSPMNKIGNVITPWMAFICRKKAFILNQVNIYMLSEQQTLDTA